MNTIEAQIWNYLDGNCTVKEQEEIKARIAAETEWINAFTEIQMLHSALQQMELEEPSMSFNRNVMEQVKLEAAPVALKTRLNMKIIQLISGLFLLMIGAVFIYALANTPPALSSKEIPLNWAAPDLSFLYKIQTQGLLIPFLFLDILLALICVDRLSRRSQITKSV